MDHTSILERLEREERETPFCGCGTATMAVARDGVLWLECSSLTPRKPLIRRLLTLDLEIGHTRHPIVADAELFGAGLEPGPRRTG
jgi:hypothetical protein